MSELFCLVAIAIVGIVSVVAMAFGKGVAVECFGIKLATFDKCSLNDVNRASAGQKVISCDGLNGPSGEE